MAKYKRVVVAQVIKGKKDEVTGAQKPSYIKVEQDIVLKKGDYLNLESKAQQLKSVEEATKAGKLSGEIAETIKERVEKIPDFVLFQVVRLDKQS